MRFGNDEILMRGVCFTSFLIIYPNASNSSPFEGRYQRKRPKESEREKNTLSSNHTWKKKKSTLRFYLVENFPMNPWWLLKNTKQQKRIFCLVQNLHVGKYKVLCLLQEITDLSTLTFKKMRCTFYKTRSCGRSHFENSQSRFRHYPPLHFFRPITIFRWLNPVLPLDSNTYFV